MQVQNKETVYSYLNDDSTSSGIIEARKDQAYYNGRTFTSDENLNPNLNSENSLHYSTVKTIIPGKGSIKYKFTDRITNPDSLTSKIFKIAFDYEWDEKDRLYLSKSYERGKIIKEEFYDFSNSKLKEVEYKYRNFLSRLPNLEYPSPSCSNCKASDLNYYIKEVDHQSKGYLQTQYIPVIPYLLSAQTTREYFGSKIAETKKNIGYLESPIKKYKEGLTSYEGYMWYPYPKEEKLLTISGTSTKKYLYPVDLFKENPCGGFMGCNFTNDNTIVGGQYISYQQLHYKNIFTPVIEILKSNSGKFSLKENLFYPTIQSTSEPYAIKKTRHSLLDATLDFNNYQIPVTNILDDISYDLYDNKLNILQTTDKSGIPTTKIWGYNQTLPIAEIIGITYAQLMQIFNLPTTSVGYLGLNIVSKSNLDIDEASETELINTLDIFRKNPALKNYSITVYTYNPQIGVTSITPL